METDHDELASRRASAQRPSIALPDDVDVPADAVLVTDHASRPELLDAKAEARDALAVSRDEAASRRDERLSITDVEQVALIVLLAARDRTAAALDRQEAALDRRRANEYLQLTYRDELTGALQRSPGMDQLSHEVDRAARTGDSLVIAFLDVVDLKGTNDTHGHAAGDELLRAVGRAVRHGLRSYDLVVRYGGDEFVCALPRAQLVDATRRFDEVGRLLRTLSPEASVRIGLAELAVDETLDDVIRRADRELYGKPTTVGFVPREASPE